MAWGNKTKTPTTKTGGKSTGLEDLFAAERGAQPAAKQESGDEFDFELETDLEALDPPPPAPAAAKPQPQRQQHQPAQQRQPAQHEQPAQHQQPAPAVSHEPAPPPQPVAPPPQHSACHIGESVRIEGELSGTEDTTVEGTIEGIVAFPDHRLTVAEKGCVHAEVQARSVAVYGKVVGNITAVDLVELMPSGHMDGDIRAGRVVLMDGAKFSGRIHMGWKPGDDEGGEGHSKDSAEAKSHEKSEKSEKVEKADKPKSETPQDSKPSQDMPKAEAKTDDKPDSKDEPKKS